MTGYTLHHHGAVDGVTGSCHELRADGASLLVDCGLFQGAEFGPGGRRGPAIEFPVEPVKALVVTHVHIDHVGRLPYLWAAGFRGPIYCSEPSALLLPLVLEDALKVGVTRDRALIDALLKRLGRQLRPLPYGRWAAVDGTPFAVRLKPAGHILGSAWVECRVGSGRAAPTVVFSGDLGAPYAPLLTAPSSPWRADTVVLESTYGDRDHDGRQQRQARLRLTVEQALRDRGAVLIPAFSIGRTQELLYELEAIVHTARQRAAAPGLPWDELDIIVDSPLASRFTSAYRRLRPYWDAEARRRVARGRHPLAFETLTTIDSHARHLGCVDLLRRTARPCVVIAAGGMCQGGRIVNYLAALLGDPRTNVLFVGYQAAGTPGRAIQQYGPGGGWVDLDGQRIDIRAGIETLPGYSAHAGRRDLVRFVRRMRHPPRQVRLVHGDGDAKRALKKALDGLGRGIDVVIP